MLHSHNKVTLRRCHIDQMQKMTCNQIYLSNHFEFLSKTKITINTIVHSNNSPNKFGSICTSCYRDEITKSSKLADTDGDNNYLIWTFVVRVV